MNIDAVYAQPNLTPWAQVNIPEDEVQIARVIKRNPKPEKEPAVTYYEGGEIGLIAREIGRMATASSDESSILKIADAIERQIAIIRDKQARGILGKTASGRGLRGDDWIKCGMSTVKWIRGGVMNHPPSYYTPSGEGSPIFELGNIKLPYWQFSTLAGVTCPGAGACMNKQGDITNQKWLGNKGGMGWCYSFSAWRQPAPFFRHLNNTIMMRLPDKRHILRALDELSKGRQTIVRLYVDGDFDSVGAIEFWMETLRKRPNILAYGYSKSWPQFIEYDKKIGGNWPDNYSLNLSGGSKYENVPALREKMLRLKCTRGEFIAVKMEKNYPPVKIKESLLTPDQKLVLKSGQGKIPTNLSEFVFEKNQPYHDEVRRVAREYFAKQGRKGIGFFVCPSKCGTCIFNTKTVKLDRVETKKRKAKGQIVDVQVPVFSGIGPNKHACGQRGFKAPIVIGIH